MVDPISLIITALGAGAIAQKQIFPICDRIIAKSAP